MKKIVYLCSSVLILYVFYVTLVIVFKQQDDMIKARTWANNNDDYLWELWGDE